VILTIFFLAPLLEDTGVNLIYKACVYYLIDMRLIGKLFTVIVMLGILLGASAYIIIYTEEDANNGGKDTTPPQITDITGNFTVTAGHTATITALFSDNINITDATLYYKLAGSTTWTTDSILSGSADIYIPPGTTSNYYYYVTVDDAAGNGPVGKPSLDGSLYYTITVQPSDTNGDEELLHTVFVEESTATWCTNCPNVANILHSLYESKKYNFYYVALINDTNTVAAARNNDDYNIYGFPTVFIDGGYKVIMGGNNIESIYANTISIAQGRTVPKIKLTMTAQYKNTTNEVTVTALIENKDNDTYTGRLKLYLTEIVSQVSDYSNKPYHYGFLEYLINKDISVNGKQNSTSSVTKSIAAYDYENLMIIGVVFSAQKNTGYANPPTQNPFDAYYADATTATTVVPTGNLPPQLQITSPQKDTVYMNGEILPLVDKIINRNHVIKKLENISLLKSFLHNKTYLLGKNKLITVEATDDSAIAKVEFYVDGTLQFNDTQAPYEWSFETLSNQKSVWLKTHTLKVIAYDDAGKTRSVSMTFYARI
jgi:thiol-disulfide isomerase/thioredoxin